MLDQKTIEEFKTSLEKERSLLTKELGTIATPDSNPNMKDNWNVKHFEWGENWKAGKASMRATKT